MPNLNIQRKVKTEETAPTAVKQQKSGWKTATTESKPKFQKPRQELIQTMDAVFGEGVASDGIRRKGSWGSRGGGDADSKSSSMEKPKLNLNFKIDKEAEAERLKALLRDDFIDDLSTGPLVPVQLPMVDTGTLFKNEEEEEEKDFTVTKGKKGNRILDSDDDEDEATKVKPEPSTSKKSVISGPKLTFPDLVKAQKGDLFFLQLPDHLPGEIPAKGEEETSKKCVLANLPEGYLGKIQIRKSGKTQLIMGGTHMELDLGTQVGFLQDLVAVDVPQPDEENPEESVPNMTVIGHIKHRLVMTPDWTKLFESDVVEPSSSSEDES